MPNRSSGSSFTTPRLTPGVRKLIIANVGAWILFLVLLRVSPLAWIADALPLKPQALLDWQLWRPFTYMFIHDPASTMHLIMNMLMLFLFGVQLEGMVGTRKFINIYLLSGLGGAILTVVGAAAGVALAPNSDLAHMWDQPHLGASGAVFGIILCWGGMLWEQRANFFLLGPMRVRTFVLIIVGIELLGLLSFGGGTSYTAHFGGMATGFLIGRGRLPVWNISKFGPKLLREMMQQQQEKRQAAKRLSTFDLLDGGLTSRGDDQRWGSNNDDDPMVH